MLDQIRINEQQVLYYLGYSGQELTDDVRAQIRWNIELVEKNAQPRIVSRYVPVTGGRLVLERELQISGLSVNAGADENAVSESGLAVGDFLEDCHEAILFAATLGPKVEKENMRLGVSNMADAVIFDACSSVAIEQVCDSFEEEERKKYGEQGLFLTDRYSPGYGEFPLEAQNLLCEYLNAGRRIGLSVTENHLMVPRKSVTAVIGVAKTEQKLRKRGCEVCSMFYTCSYRKAKTICGHANAD